MKNRLSIVHGLAIFALVMLTGCPPPAATKPESSTPQVSGKKLPTGEPQPSTSSPTSPPSSSMEDLRQGRAPVTPASSPLKEIYFNFDRYNLRPDARSTLKANADWLKSHPSVRVEIEGHCDERGTSEYNLALGAKRAQSAKDYLVTLGVSADRLSTISYGEELPACKPKTQECWQRNRRDRFVIITERPAS